MDLMERRREIIEQMPAEHWDYTILPTSPDAQGIGRFDVVKIDVASGKSVLIKYEGISGRNNGWVICDGYFAGIVWNPYETSILTCARLENDNGQMQSTPSTKAGQITIGASRASVETFSPFTIKSIKIRIV
ncbi:MAG: hypothetical protein IIZ68_02485 [Clostridia bacterium]|nr:hypothetical protein [Clostridia bacterium]